MEQEFAGGRTLIGIFLNQADRLGDRPLTHFHDGRGWVPVTWNQQRRSALRVAAALVELGVKPGDRVILMSGNRIEWLYCDLGIQAAGAISVPVYPSSAPHTARQIVEGSGATVAIVGGPAEAERLPVAGPLRRVLQMDSELAAYVAREPEPGVAAEVRARVAAIEPDDVLTVIYTSGTTGEPKGVVLANRNVVDMARNSLRSFPIGEDDVALSFLPYSHVLERVNGVAVGITAGAQGYIARGMDHVVEDLAQVRPTIMVSVPRMYEKMHERVLDQVRRAPALRRRLFHWALRSGLRRAAGSFSPGYPLADRLVLSKLRAALTGGRLRFFVSGGAPLAVDVEQFFWAIGVRILQGWGMTETSSGATSNTASEHRWGTVGRALPGVEVRIADDGEVLVRGDGIMLGYFNNPAATSEALVDGWMHTGDIGELDAGGFLRITDRKKDLIKTAGGKYVAPQPIEARLQHDPLIERAVVIGDERPYCVALIVPNFDAARARLGLRGEPATLVGDAALRRAVQTAVDGVNRELGSWESIKYFHLLPEDFSEAAGEVTPTLKVKRRVVQERHAAAIDALYKRERTATPAPAVAP